MSEEEAHRIWKIIQSNHVEDQWAEIEEVEPDEIDLQMLNEAEKNPDCHEFVSEDEMRKTFGEQ